MRATTRASIIRIRAHLARETNVFASWSRPGTGEAARAQLDPTRSHARHRGSSRRAASGSRRHGRRVNANLPICPARPRDERADYEVMLQPEGEPYDLFAPPRRPTTPCARAATLIKDGGTLLIGIGSFSDALAHADLTHANNADSCLSDQLVRRWPRRSWTLRDRPLRCTEMLVDGYPPWAGRNPAPARRRRRPDGAAVLHAGSSSATRRSIASSGRCGTRSWPRSA